jgi:hypothetical protein
MLQNNINVNQNNVDCFLLYISTATSLDLHQQTPLIHLGISMGQSLGSFSSLILNVEICLLLLLPG